MKRRSFLKKEVVTASIVGLSISGINAMDHFKDVKSVNNKKSQLNYAPLISMFKNKGAQN